MTIYTLTLHRGRHFQEALAAVHSLRSHLRYLQDGSSLRFDEEEELWVARLSQDALDSGSWSQLLVQDGQGLTLDVPNPPSPPRKPKPQAAG